MRSRATVNRSGVFLLAVLLAAALLPVSPAAAPAEIGRSIPFPASETESWLHRWLSGTGFEVSRRGTAEGGARLSAHLGGETWDIVVVPDSPLACRVLAEFVRNGTADPSGAANLKDLLDRHVQGSGGGSEAAGAAAPPAVRAKAVAAVCVSAPRRGADAIRFSGVMVDGSGSVVSTAHDLEGVETVTVYLEAGREAEGRLVRRDPARDLSLIRIRGGVPAHVHLADVRDVPAEGEFVYTIGCPVGDRPRVRRGFVSGPPVKANGMPLWPVEMETLPGSSGGPVFDGGGSLVGVVKGRYRGTESKGFVIPARTIVDFLEEARTGRSKGERR